MASTRRLSAQPPDLRASQHMFPWPSQAAAYRALQSDAPHVAVADHAGSGKTLAYLAPLVQVQASRVCVPMRLPIVVAVAASILPSRRPLHSCVLLLGAHGSARHLQLNTDIWRCWCRRCGLRKTAASPVLNWLHSCTFGTSHEGSPSPSSECETNRAAGAGAAGAGGGGGQAGHTSQLPSPNHHHAHRRYAAGTAQKAVAVQDGTQDGT